MARIWLKIVPGSKTNRIEPLLVGVLQVRIKSRPEKNRANFELQQFLAKRLGLTKSQVTIVRGMKSHLKLINIDSLLTKDEIVEKLVRTN